MDAGDDRSAAELYDLLVKIDWELAQAGEPSMTELLVDLVLPAIDDPDAQALIVDLAERLARGKATGGG